MWNVAGNDVVTNTVDGARINTGSGNDIIANKASGTVIDTGDGEDKVRSEAFQPARMAIRFEVKATEIQYFWDPAPTIPPFRETKT